MRCHYLSDLHLESETFEQRLPKGDVLIIAGDLCHARCLDPSRTDKYNINQRNRVMRFIDEARSNFAHVLSVAGNHEHYDGIFEETVPLLRRQLPGITVLDVLDRFRRPQRNPYEQGPPPHGRVFFRQDARHLGKQ